MFLPGRRGRRTPRCRRCTGLRRRNRRVPGRKTQSKSPGTTVTTTNTSQYRQEKKQNVNNANKLNRVVKTDMKPMNHIIIADLFVNVWEVTRLLAVERTKKDTNRSDHPHTADRLIIIIDDVKVISQKKTHQEARDVSVLGHELDFVTGDESLFEQRNILHNTKKHACVWQVSNMWCAKCSSDEK